MKKILLVLYSPQSITYNLFSELKKNENIEIVLIHRTNSKFLLKICNFCGDIISSLFISKILSKYKKENFIVLFDNEALRGISKKSLVKIKNAYFKTGIFFIDSLDNSYPTIFNAKKYYFDKMFDFSYTCSLYDATKYSIPLNLSYYHRENVECLENTNDIYFLGAIKKRLTELKSLSEKFAENGINYNYLLRYKSKKKISDFSHNRINYISYKENLKNVMSTNCILDIVDQDSNCVSLRYYEAVVYNKKLLTNNEQIKNYPFYDPRYMKVFTNEKDIDYDWIKEKEKINYHYDGRFEPFIFMERIVKENS